jgi:hypothetical protein
MTSCASGCQECIDTRAVGTTTARGYMQSGTRGAGSAPLLCSAATARKSCAMTCSVSCSVKGPPVFMDSRNRLSKSPPMHSLRMRCVRELKGNTVLACDVKHADSCDHAHTLGASVAGKRFTARSGF